MSTPSDAARQALYARLEEVLGEAHAATLMTNLPPTPWNELATKADLRHLETRFDLFEARFVERMERIDDHHAVVAQRLDRIDLHLERSDERFVEFQTFLLGQYRNYSVTMVSGLVALTAIFAALMTVLTLVA